MGALLLTMLIFQTPEAEAVYQADEARRAEVRERQRVEVAAEIEAERQAEEALRAKCGKDFHKVRVGMAWARVQECSGPFDVKAQDEKGTVYEAAGGFVRVERGKVKRWIAK